MRRQIISVLEIFKPRYSELAAFLTALTCVVVAVTYPETFELLSEFLSGGGSGEVKIVFASILFVAFAMVVFVLSIFHVSTNRQKAPWEQTLMGVFVLSANGFAGVFSGSLLFLIETPP